MVRSKSSCLKIITCGSDSVDEDDFERTERTSLTDKRGWSFRKRSTRHRVLSNTVISETPSTGKKESPDPTSIDFHSQINPTVPEKFHVPQWTDEMSPLATAVNANVPDPIIATENACQIDPLISTGSATKNDSLIMTDNACKIDHNLEESAAIVIQAAIREYLAQRALLKLKNVVKLQAAVRGHLVRRQAVGTLRCAQAIVKLQALVRARHAHLSSQGSVIEARLDVEKNSQSVKTLGKENSGSKAIRSYSSAEKWLRNGFACQLLKSTTEKRILIKCDPSRPDSAWQWLERWMAVSSSNLTQPQEPQFSPEYQEQEERMDTASEIGVEIPDQVISESVDLESTVRKTAIPLPREDEENLITYNTYNADDFDFHASVTDDMQQTQLDNVDFSKEKETSSLKETNQTDMMSDAASQTLLASISDKPEADSEPLKRSVKRVASEQPETEGKKFMFGSRKASNPAFVAVQSKFEELSLSATSGRSINSTCQDDGLESKLGSLSPLSDSVTTTNELSLTENTISHEPRVQVGGSECSTDLSISSTLDSPERSEVGGRDLEHEAEVVEKVTSEPNGAIDNASNLVNPDVEANNVSSTSDPDSSFPANVDVNRETVASVVGSPQVAQHPERSASDVQTQLDTPTDLKTYRSSSSPEGSPRSHITVPESHGTPSSQVSVKAKRNKLDKSGPTQKRKSQSAGKMSPSNPNHDSGARSSTEQLVKEQKNGKRRNSFGSARPDQIDHEPREGSNNSLPSYMQATESARAKALANTSPRSSPDMQGKDIHIKKRHSLPGTNGKQGSPRMQRSNSQAQHGTKGNGTPTQERKWQR